MLLSLALLTAVSLSTAGQAPGAPPVQRVLVLDLEAVGVSPEEAAAAARVIASAAADVPGVVVMSTADLRRLAELEANRAAVGCDDDTSCLAEIAGALGAERVLSGSLSRLGSTTTVVLSLYDARTQTMERKSSDVQDISQLTPLLRARTAELLAAKQTSTSSPPSGGAAPAGASNAGPPVLIAGAVVTGLGAGAIGASEWVLQDPKAAGSTKETMRLVGFAGVGAVALGAGAMVVGAVLWSLGGE